MTEKSKTLLLSGGLILCIAMIVVVTYSIAMQQHRDQFFEPVMTLAKELCIESDLSPKFPPAFGRVLGVKSLALGGHFVHVLSL